MARRDRHPVTRAVHVLRKAKVEVTPHLYDYVDGGGTRASALALGVDEHAVVKTLVFEDDRGEPLIVLMHGDRQVSAKELARAIGAKRVAPCEPKVADRHSGYQVGGTSPFGTRRAMPVYMERSIAELGAAPVVADRTEERIVKLFIPIALAALLSSACSTDFAIEGRVVTAGDPEGLHIFGTARTDSDLVALGSDYTSSSGHYYLSVDMTIADLKSVEATFFGVGDNTLGTAEVSMNLGASSGTHTMPDLLVPEWSISAEPQGPEVVVGWTPTPALPVGTNYEPRFFDQDIDDHTDDTATIDSRLLVLPSFTFNVVATTRGDPSSMWLSPHFTISGTPVSHLAVGASCSYEVDGADAPLEQNGACPLTDQVYDTFLLDAATDWVTIDLGTVREVTAVSTHALKVAEGAFEVRVSTDGAVFTAVGSSEDLHAVVELESPVQARYVRLAGVDAAIEAAFEVGVF